MDLVDLKKGDRIRPKESKSFRIKTKEYSVEFTLHHQQLWCVDCIDEEKCVLSNSGNTMKLTLDEKNLTELFDVLHTTCGRYYTNPNKKYYGQW